MITPYLFLVLPLACLHWIALLPGSLGARLCTCLGRTCCACVGMVTGYIHTSYGRAPSCVDYHCCTASASDPGTGCPVEWNWNLKVIHEVTKRSSPKKGLARGPHLTMNPWMFYVTRPA